jgi:voltage-gated potassium channel
MVIPDPEHSEETAKQSPYLLFMLFASFIALVALAFQAFGTPEPSTRTILEYLDVLMCMLFFVDFLISFHRAPNKWRYMVTWGWLDLVSSIPVLENVRWARTARVFRIVRLLRGVRSAKILSQFILVRRTQSALLAVGLLIVLLLAVGSIAILNVERPLGDEANIRTAEDALWWAIVTITTVGYGDKHPVSIEGRVIASVLMIAGVGLFGSLSGLMAAWLLAPDEQKREGELAALRADIRELKLMLSRTAEPVGSARKQSAGD